MTSRHVNKYIHRRARREYSYNDNVWCRYGDYFFEYMTVRVCSKDENRLEKFTEEFKNNVEVDCFFVKWRVEPQITKQNDRHYLYARYCGLVMNGSDIERVGYYGVGEGFIIDELE